MAARRPWVLLAVSIATLFIATTPGGPPSAWALEVTSATLTGGICGVLPVPVEAEIQIRFSAGDITLTHVTLFHAILEPTDSGGSFFVKAGSPNFSTVAGILETGGDVVGWGQSMSAPTGGAGGGGGTTSDFLHTLFPTLTQGFLGQSIQGAELRIDSFSLGPPGSLPACDWHADYSGVLIVTTQVALEIIDPDLRIDQKGGHRSFELHATLGLGAASDGAHPLTEPVTLGIGGLSFTIPAGAFRQQGNGTFRFDGRVGGTRLEVKLVPEGGNQFRLRAEGDGPSIAGLTNPVPVTVSIGDDAGAASVDARFK
jgi:hypothetical protein